MKILKPLAILGCLIVTVPSHAQTAAPAAATAAPATAQLTPEQARQAIDTLQNDAKRTEIINALRAIASTSGANGAQQATPPQNDPPAALPADSLGAQLLLRL
jgi:hypothetical protein